MRDPTLVENYVKYCEIASQTFKNGELNLMQLSWVYPTTLLPVFHLKQEFSFKCRASPEISKYLKIMEKGKVIKGSTYLPFVQLTNDKSEEILDYLHDMLDEDYGGKNALSYLLCELTDNIYQHSKFNSSYILAQKYPKKGFMEICFLDDGISIPGNFEKHDYPFEDDSDAITKAMNGVSTKDIHERGYGLNSILHIFKDNGGEMLVVSRRGVFYNSQETSENYLLRKPNEFQGTLVSLRVYKTTINIYDYI
ncbi:MULTISPECIES: ATP-binding protein [Methanothermobacter]|uniref:ATP-binding protein n=2 Tax=root TaxID=1 RepID=A0A9E7RSH2_METWO|nr:ATP-binding protein [Methanothermobacter wolfeii]UXH31525.1 ATP-binding protein [Methanothermobacter wolfeii]